MCRKNSSKSKMQQISLKINNKIQNDSPKFSIVGVFLTFLLHQIL
jgi:hypothetical protein